MWTILEELNNILRNKHRLKKGVDYAVRLRDGKLQIIGAQVFKETIKEEAKALELEITVFACVTEDGKLSDSYHTMEELYEHRIALYLKLMSLMPTISWFSKEHDDGSSFPGWFIAGIDLDSGTITYHLPLAKWDKAVASGATALPKGKEWDGHTSSDVVQRLYDSIGVI